MFGGAFGNAVSHLFPSLDAHPGNFAIVGMVAFFAAAAKAPISTIIMISEMTGGYGLLAPAMFAVVTVHMLDGVNAEAVKASLLDPIFVNLRHLRPHIGRFGPEIIQPTQFAQLDLHRIMVILDETLLWNRLVIAGLVALRSNGGGYCFAGFRKRNGSRPADI